MPWDTWETNYGELITEYYNDDQKIAPRPYRCNHHRGVVYGAVPVIEDGEVKELFCDLEFPYFSRVCFCEVRK